MEKGNILWKKDKLNIFWDQCAHLNNRPSEDPYNFGQSVVEREESMDIAMITDQFALNKPLMSQTTSEIANWIVCAKLYCKTSNRN